MQVKWLLEKDMFEDNLDAIKAAILAQGMEYKEIHYIPFQSESYNFSDYYADDECVIVYGSLNLSRLTQRKAKWVPGVWCDFEKLECVHYYNYVGEHLLNKDYIMLPYGELNRQKDFLLSTLAVDGCLFIRPSSGYKLFTGQVIHADSWDKDVEYLGFYDVSPEKIVVVSQPKKIQAEWRLIVVGQTVAAGSQYKENGLTKLREAVPQEVIDYTNQIAACWQPDPAWVVDICRSNDELKLLEYNSFSSSGWYVCDKNELVRAAAELAIKEWEDYHG